MATQNEKSNKANSGDRGNGRIGKALLKYFKPIRSALPHSYPWQNNSQKKEDASNKTTLDLTPDISQATDSLAKNSPDSPTGPPDKQGQKDNSLAIEVASGPMLTPAQPNDPLTPAVKLAEMPKHWLELILTLLSACKRVSVKMGSQLGMQTYRTMLANRGRSNIQSKGSIIDTTPIATSDEEEGEDDFKRSA